eukprot:TRINITY_DN111105_c0_g1_i1.p1 TRINITY_DN111105_c0_g1~~TRINITY_DN111105_c0_g1_i1.p1  ORF type:complete len:217 (+),score=47.02 TRINITY_DN111105_c0_g1_i1:56-706(+)
MPSFNRVPAEDGLVNLSINDTCKLSVQTTCAEENGNTWSGVWPGALAMAEWVADNPVIKNCKVVELGAGTGLVGLTASATGAAHVVLTDLPPALDALKANVAMNSKRHADIEVQQLCWGSQEDLEAVGTADVVLAADVVYDLDTHEPLAKTIQGFLLRNRSARCFLVQELRWKDVQRWFNECLEDLGLYIDQTALPAQDMWLYEISMKARLTQEHS